MLVTYSCYGASDQFFILKKPVSHAFWQRATVSFVLLPLENLLWTVVPVAISNNNYRLAPSQTGLCACLCRCMLGRSVGWVCRQNSLFLTVSFCFQSGKAQDHNNPAPVIHTHTHTHTHTHLHAQVAAVELARAVRVSTGENTLMNEHHERAKAQEPLHLRNCCSHPPRLSHSVSLLHISLAPSRPPSFARWAPSLFSPSLSSSPPLSLSLSLSLRRSVDKVKAAL